MITINIKRGVAYGKKCERERDCKPKEPLDFRYTKLALNHNNSRRVETQSGVRHFELSNFLLSHN